MHPMLTHAHAQSRYEELLREASIQRTVRSRLAARQALLDRVRAERPVATPPHPRSVRRGLRVALATWVVRRLAPELLEGAA